MAREKSRVVAGTRGKVSYMGQGQGGSENRNKVYRISARLQRALQHNKAIQIHERGLYNHCETFGEDEDIAFAAQGELHPGRCFPEKQQSRRGPHFNVDKGGRDKPGLCRVPAMVDGSRGGERGGGYHKQACSRPKKITAIGRSRDCAEGARG